MPLVAKMPSLCGPLGGQTPHYRLLLLNVDCRYLVSHVLFILWSSLTTTSTNPSDPASNVLSDAQGVPNGWITDIAAHITVSLLSIHLSSSMVPHVFQIHKERALRVYLLNAVDLNDVPFDDGLYAVTLMLLQTS